MATKKATTPKAKATNAKVETPKVAPKAKVEKKVFEIVKGSDAPDNAPKGQTTTTIPGFPSIPELSLGDTIKFEKPTKGGDPKEITGTIQRFFHHNGLNRNEAKLKGPNGERIYVLEKVLNPDAFKEEVTTEVTKEENIEEVS